jgi:hypothetical protein
MAFPIVSALRQDCRSPELKDILIEEVKRTEEMVRQAGIIRAAVLDIEIPKARKGRHKFLSKGIEWLRALSLLKCSAVS